MTRKLTPEEKREAKKRINPDIPDEIRDRVEAGVKWLDMKVPDWRGRINLGTLNLISHTTCVLGQVFGHYGRAVTDNAELLGRGAAQHGFSHTEHMEQSLSARSAEYAQLQAAWEEELS